MNDEFFDFLKSQKGKKITASSINYDDGYFSGTIKDVFITGDSSFVLLESEHSSLLLIPLNSVWVSFK